MNDRDIPSGPSDFEVHKLNVELKKFQTQIENDNKKFRSELIHNNWRTTYEAANAAGRAAINALLLASGGAVVALLAFLGNLLSKDTSHDYLAQTRISTIVHNVALVLQLFAISMLLSVLATAFVYLSMFYFSGSARWRGEDEAKADRYEKIGNVLNNLSIVTGIASFGMLVYGARVGLTMLQTL